MSKARVFSREYKAEAVRRVKGGESVAAVANELGLRRKLIYDWKKRIEAGGVESLGKVGRPKKGTTGHPNEAQQQARRVAELERLVGRQQALISFFESALQKLEKMDGETGKASFGKPFANNNGGSQC